MSFKLSEIEHVLNNVTDERQVRINLLNVERDCEEVRGGHPESVKKWKEDFRTLYRERIERACPFRLCIGSRWGF